MLGTIQASLSLHKTEGAKNTIFRAVAIATGVCKEWPPETDGLANVSLAIKHCPKHLIHYLVSELMSEPIFVIEKHLRRARSLPKQSKSVPK